MAEIDAGDLENKIKITVKTTREQKSLTVAADESIVNVGTFLFFTI